MMMAPKIIFFPTWSLPIRSTVCQKIHKANIPLRPIVDTIGSPTYKLATYLAKLLAVHIGNSDSIVKDSNHFFQFIKDARCDSNDILIIFDIISLFTKVPILESIEIVKRKVNDEVASLVKLCL